MVNAYLIGVLVLVALYFVYYFYRLNKGFSRIESLTTQEQIEREEQIRKEKIENMIPLQFVQSIFYLMGIIAFVFYIFRG